MTFAVAGLGRHSIIIGHTWLKYHNPDIDWSSGKLCFTRCPSQCSRLPKTGPIKLPPSWPAPKLIWEPDTLELKALLSQESEEHLLNKIPTEYSDFG
jgi:hypothetical protein